VSPSDMIAAVARSKKVELEKAGYGCAMLSRAGQEALQKQQLWR
jgi:hypothetical protein